MIDKTTEPDWKSPSKYFAPMYNNGYVQEFQNFFGDQINKDLSLMVT
jgi:hypothetical protein